MLMHDPDLEATRGLGGTLMFLDGAQYCVVVPDFVSVEESDCYAFGSTKTITSQPRVMGSVSSAGPVDVTLMPDGRTLLVANYESEQVTFLRVRDLARKKAVR